MPLSVSAHTIERPRLIARIDDDARYRITVLVAPAGYGKSTALREYVEGSDGAATAWYRVRSGHGSAVGFARGLIEALAPAVGPAPLNEYVYANGTRDVHGLLQWLIAAIAPFKGSIAVDDLHVATGEGACAAFIASTITESGPDIRWILSTRSVTNLPLASWRSRGDAGEPIGEMELALTANESLRLSRACGVDVSDQVIDHVAGLTRGWPAAFAFGIRLAARGIAAASVATYTQTFIDDLIEEAILSKMTPAQRAFLMDTSLLTRVDPAVVRGRYGFDVDAMLQTLRRDVSFVGLDASGAYTYHDLFKDFLRREIRKGDRDTIARRVRWAADVLVKSDEPDAALDLCLEMDAPDVAIELLERVGFLLIEGGYVDVAERAAALLQAMTLEHPVVYGIRATLESLHGNDVRAEELFSRAIALAGGDLAVDLRIRLATHRLNQRDTAGAADALEGHCEEALRPDLRLSVLTIRACIAAREGDEARARAPLEAAVALTRGLHDEIHVAIAHHQIALVLYLLGHFERARAYATSAIQISERRRIGCVGARARSVLSAIAAELGNTGVQRQINHDLRAIGRAARDPKLHFFALANLFVIEIEAGHLAAARTIEAELHQFDATLFRDSEEALYPAYALRAAWEGEFGVAHAYLRGTDAHLSPQTRRLLRQCEIALYGAASGELAESRRLADSAMEMLRTSSAGKALHSRALTARILLALTYGLLDECRCGSALLETVRYATAVQRRAFDRLVAAARAFLRGRASGDDRIAGSLGRLRDSDLGGYALLLESLSSVPALRPFGDPPSALTAAERAVLDRLSRGLTSKEIAAAFGKSRYTIDTQVKSIVKKFGCSGRNEAVYLARRYGMLE